MIIDNNIDYNKSLKLWISPNKKIKASLLYKLSRDGEEFSKFHQLCDNKGPTLTLFDIEDGVKGGIYTPLSWNSNSEWKTDMDTFIFNLTKNKKYKKIQNYNSIFCESDYGPWVNGFGFLGDNQMKEIQLYGPSINYCYEKGSEILPNNGSSKKYFKVTEWLEERNMEFTIDFTGYEFSSPIIMAHVGNDPKRSILIRARRIEAEDIF
jgi:hypothetical protein